MENIHNINEMIVIKQADIVEFVETEKIDAIVNAVHPTLRRGKGHCVDAAINERLDELSRCKNYLQKLINEGEKKDNKSNNDIIKCKRGDILVTSGDRLCKYIIHTVGPQNDNDNEKPRVCSSSCINTLRSCYRKIILEVLSNKYIRTIAIPILSAGNYGIDFELAFKVGISEVYNTLLEKKQQDTELFQLSRLEKVYFIIDGDENFRVAQEIQRKYEPVFQKEKRISVFKTRESQLQYLKEVRLYDSQKGYFSIAKFFRQFIIKLRLFSIYTYLNDWIGKQSWERRRQVVEIVALGKMILPMVSLILLRILTKPEWLCILVFVFVGYGLADTITYLLELIVLADIQSPSANIIRSIILLFLNYFEAVFAIAAIGYAWIPEQIGVKAILTFAVLGTEIAGLSGTWEYMWLSFLNSGVQFFFLSIAFAYFANHLRQRKFRTK